MREAKEKTAIQAIEVHGRQYKDEQILKTIVEAMFSTFVQQANCDIGVIIHD